MASSSSWQMAVLLMVVVAVTLLPAHAQEERQKFWGDTLGPIRPPGPVDPVDPVDPPEDECPSSCSQPQCKEKADLDELYPGVFREATDYAEEIPEGCSVDFTDARDDGYESMSCTSNVQARFFQVYKRYLWGDGNCCCPAYRYLSCPKHIRIGSTTYTVANWGSKAQCFTEARCGIENGICQGRCTPIYHYRTVLVYDPRCFVRWVSYRYAAACRCTTCTGGYCRSGFLLGDGNDK